MEIISVKYYFRLLYEKLYDFFIKKKRRYIIQKIHYSRKVQF